MTNESANAAFTAAKEYTPDAAEWWPEPESLISPIDEPKPYPLTALPTILRNAVVSYQAFGQQPVELVACSALGTAALAVQGLVDVARDQNLIGPVSLNLLAVAQSGERKTSADRRISRAARDWVKDQREILEPEIATARANKAAWEAERDGILSKIKSKAGKIPEDMEGLRADLADLEANPPDGVIRPTLFYEDVTPEGLAQCIASGWPSTSLWSDEGGLVVGSHGMSDDSALRFLGLLNRLWDGNPFERKRTTAQSFTITGRRFTCSLMMQGIVLTKLLAAAGGASRGTGFLARFLMTWPTSTMGTRLYRAGDLNSGAMTAFDDRIHSLLNLPLPANGPEMELQPTRLFLSDTARRAWIGFHDDVERELKITGDFADVGDIASKSAENAARIAGVFHVLENGPEGQISAATMEAGAALAAWHLFEARRILGALDTPQAITDAVSLLGWLVEQGGKAELREILRLGPNPLRDRKRRDAAIRYLAETNNAAEVKAGGKAAIKVNPKIAGGQNEGS